MLSSAIISVGPLGFPWRTIDPFLFCVHHDDAYPRGNDAMGPRASLDGRSLGQDFAGKDGWNMYHGMTVPGFPAHPHRGFETVTIVRNGFIDHSDSLGATARFGAGDTQWLTAGQGIVHAEMFPLRERDRANPLELFQIWLNLPARLKMVEPHFTMLWSEDMPRQRVADDAGRVTEVVCIAGNYGTTVPESPPPNSWASQTNADVAIWTIKMDKGARWRLPAAVGVPRPGAKCIFSKAVSSRLMDSRSLNLPPSNSTRPPMLRSKMAMTLANSYCFKVDRSASRWRSMARL